MGIIATNHLGITKMIFKTRRDLESKAWYRALIVARYIAFLFVGMFSLSMFEEVWFFSIVILLLGLGCWWLLEQGIIYVIIGPRHK